MLARPSSSFPDPVTTTRAGSGTPAAGGSASAPRCAKCRRRHLLVLPCWSGRYARRLAAAVLATYGDTCCHCGGPGSSSTEHVRPRSRGGTDDLGNLRPAHLVCNLQRGTKPMIGWGTPTLTETRSNRW